MLDPITYSNRVSKRYMKSLCVVYHSLSFNNFCVLIYIFFISEKNYFPLRFHFYYILCQWIIYRSLAFTALLCYQIAIHFIADICFECTAFPTETVFGMQCTNEKYTQETILTLALKVAQISSLSCLMCCAASHCIAINRINMCSIVLYCAAVHCTMYYTVPNSNYDILYCSVRYIVV